MYRIKNWEKHFEISQSKRVEGALSWVPVPTKHDSLPFRRIMAMDDGPAIFGAWVLILQVAAKCKVRGMLGELSEDGPVEFGPGELAMMTGCPSLIFSRALEVLTSKGVGWIIEESSEKAYSVLRERSDSTHLQEKTGEESTEQEKGASRGKPRLSQPSDCDGAYLVDLQKREAYSALNVRVVYSKMVVWCEQNHKQPTRKRLLNWLNREDRPMTGGLNGKPKEQPVQPIKDPEFMAELNRRPRI